MFKDFAELKKNMDGSDDLTHEQAMDMFIKYVRGRGIAIETPRDPFNDLQFIRNFNAAYDIGVLLVYSVDAAVSSLRFAAWRIGWSRLNI